ncbi:hypothetical protein OIDMADRAFT_26443 [Oidiodendron maius Zn]|uniref:RING-type domain-containing protein n=1 Tax=Oidiodendron maius (strain Zn) TaxID=913774 RepID=A0A0C3HL90_OIDMZ|nr:hypothetical protein OIDMADRAFT_26443 [Oidiodendron maius Zn]
MALPRRVSGTKFQLRYDGCVEMPTWAAELMFIFIIYSPYSLVEIVAQLKTIEQFREHLDECGLIYSFCMALHTKDPVLFNLVSLDEVSGHYHVPAHLHEEGVGDQDALLFWNNADGLSIRFTVMAIMESFQFRELEGQQYWQVLRAWVDTYGQRGRREQLLLAAYREASPSVNQEDDMPGNQGEQTMARARSILETLRIEPTLPEDVASGQDNAVPGPRARFLSPDTFSRLFLFDIVYDWRRPHPEGMGETCSICLNHFPAPGTEECVANTPVCTPCNHYFGLDCLIEWLQDHDTCPLCRNVLLAEGQRVTLDRLRGEVVD